MTESSVYLETILDLSRVVEHVQGDGTAPDYTVSDVLTCMNTLLVAAQREYQALMTKVDALERAPAPRYSYLPPVHTPPVPAWIPVVMTPDQYREVWDLALTQYGKIPAIKQCREYSRVGLKEAKDYVECMMSRAAKEGYVVATTPEPTPDPDDDIDDLPF